MGKCNKKKKEEEKEEEQAILHSCDVWLGVKTIKVDYL
jgi:hypothetical protein